MQQIVLILAFTAMSLSMTACNTIAGAGKDLQKGGQKIQSSAVTNQSKVGTGN